MITIHVRYCAECCRISPAVDRTDYSDLDEAGEEELLALLRKNGWIGESLDEVYCPECVEGILEKAETVKRISEKADAGGEPTVDIKD